MTHTGDPVVEQLLDAALAQFEDLGIRRSTVEDIARRAGVDRVTVYRRVGAKDDIIEAVLTREAHRLLAYVTAAVTPLPALADRVAETFAITIGYLRTNALFQRMLALEPEGVLPRVTTEAAPLLAIGTEAVAELIRYDQDTGGGIAADVDADATAEILVRLVHSFVLTPRASHALETDDELRAFARDHVTPLLNRGAADASGAAPAAGER